MIETSSSTLNASWVVYGEGVSDDDPAELYHEASSLSPSQIGRQLPGIYLLETNSDLKRTSTRSTKRHPHVETIALPPGSIPDGSLASVVTERRSIASFSDAPVSLAQVGTMLHTAYGVTQRMTIEPGTVQTFRTIPSAGALFPLEIYCLAFNVDGLTPAIYHFDPIRNVLERVRDGELRAELRNAVPMDGLVSTCPVAFVVTAMLWRSRFKYGQRGYRFALLEAGHLTQNLLLASTALGLGSVPIGGFYDRRVADLLAIDGVNEVPLYVVPVGSKP